MAQKHNEYKEQPMTRAGTIQGPSRRYRRLRHPNFPAAEWADKNPLLQRGELGIEKDTHKMKAGDGVTYWNDLPYMYDDAGQPLSTADYQMGNASGGWDTMLQAQQDALNSGATTTNIGQIATNTNDITNINTTIGGYGDIVTHDVSEFATAAQGAKADTAVQPGDLATVATSGDYDDLLNKPTLGTAAAADTTDFATAAQGALADTAVQPADLANYVTINTTQTITGEKTFSGIMNYSAGKTYILAGNGGTKLGYWSYDIDGQSNITLQTMTASTRNINFKTNNGGKVTYNGSEIAKVSDLPSVMTGATAGDAGASGLVPAPAAGDQAKFLQGDGTWANPTATTAWGNITGTLSDQTDLQSALNAKQDTLTAGTNITITSNTISATDTTYTGSDGITLTGTNFTNSGVRSVASGTTNGTISVNTGGITADVAVTGLGSAAYTASSAYATSAQGGKADTAVQPGDLATVATTGDYDDLLNTPTLGTMAAESANDYTPTSSLATVATSGDYGDLLNKPTIPTVNDATLTIQKNGTTVNTFTANASSNVTVNITVPTKISDLTNDSNFANTDLSNLTSTGKNIGLWCNNAANIITEIPQDIKLELNSGTLTLKAGSKVYVPNGAGVFDEITTTADITVGSPYTNAPLFLYYYNGGIQQAAASAQESGSSYTITGGFWYDTTNNYVKRINSGSVAYSGVSFPIGIVSATSGSWSNIDQVFNGFGYMGSTVFALPGVKGLAPNGFNADGTLKNNAKSVPSVLTYTLSGTYDFTLVCTDAVIGAYFYAYDVQTNQVIRTDTGAAYNGDKFIFGKASTTNGKITSFATPKKVFHAVDYNDYQVDFVVASQLPTSANNYTWYRKYKSGWVEQGGIKSVDQSSGTTITLPIVMLDTNYTAVTTNNSYTSGTGQYATTCSITSASQITIKTPGSSATNTFSWQVSGVAA